MKSNNRFCLIILMALLLFPSIAWSQATDDINKVDVDNNEVWTYGVVGKNNIHGFYQGMNAFYTRHINDRVGLLAGIDINSKKNGFGGILAEGNYKLPLKHFNLIFSGRGVYNYYGDYKTHEYLFRLAVHAQSNHFDVLFGNSFLGYSMFGSSVFEPITWSVGFGVNVKPRTSSWNIGLFLKNYDYFIYENWNINFGLRGYYNLNPKLRLTAEILVRPAGNMNQLAVKYDTGFKLGANFKW